MLINNNTIITLTSDRLIQIWDLNTLREITNTIIPTDHDCGDECVDDVFFLLTFAQFRKENSNLIAYDMKSVWPIFSSKKSVMMVGNGIKRSIQFYQKEARKKLATLYLDSNNEWLIITPDGYFDGSPESRKHLYMKTSSGESVPIDDTTFQKYHTQINFPSFQSSSLGMHMKVKIFSFPLRRANER
jgi:hypothetical protein